MRTLLLSAVLLMCQPLWPQSLIGRARYVPEKVPVDSAILATQAFVNNLPPLPQYQRLPEQLPADLQMSYDEWQQTHGLREANRLVSTGSPEKAVDIYRSFLEDHPEEVQIRVALADSLFAMKNFAAAEDEYLKALKRAPFHFQALNNLAWMYCTSPLPDQHRPAEALNMARRAQTLMPNSHHVWSTLSQAWYQLGEYGKALEAGNNAINLAARTGAHLRTQITYLIQADKCRLALQATSILEE